MNVSIRLQLIRLGLESPLFETKNPIEIILFDRVLTVYYCVSLRTFQVVIKLI